MHYLLNQLYEFLTRIRKDPLRRYIYLLLWPWFVPVVGYLIFGDAFTSNATSLVAGMVVVLMLSGVANELDTYALHQVLRWYPDLDDSWWRLGWMAVAFNTINMLLAEASLWAFDATHFLGYTYQPETNRWVLCFVFISGIVAAGLVESAYAFKQWQTNQMDRQTLEQANLELQLSNLKSRVNPHFLFNSLNSVSALISAEPQLAELLVDDLSQVYRYMLQANKDQVVTVKAEIQFIQAYVRLLEARFGKALRIDLQVDVRDEPRLIPPLTLQVLLDEIVQYNSLKATSPLHIVISSDGNDRLCVHHNRQPRILHIDRQLPGLEDVVARYRWISQQPVAVDTSELAVTIWLPLLQT